ncbi:MAG: hypothetical protein ICV68_12130, partial [Pyrinomonadaceae bacterium]|nr:hypothetical protein [Pyrinomonadaceae bacterium]
MMNERTTNPAAKALLFALIVTAVTSTAFAFSKLARTVKTAQGQPEVTKADMQGKGKFKVGEVSKKAKIDKADAAHFVTISLNGLRPTDYVNLRPSDKPQVEVTAGAMVEESTPKGGLPESAFEVAADKVTFTRPQEVGGTVVLDIQLPAGVHVQAVADGSVILNRALQEPLSIQGQQVRPGEANFASAVLRAGMPAGLRGAPFDKGDRWLPASGLLFVHFSKLQVIKSVPVNTDSPLNRAALEINEQGKVVKVTPLAKNSDAELESALRQWEFAPYLVDGRPTPV